MERARHFGPLSWTPRHWREARAGEPIGVSLEIGRHVWIFWIQFFPHTWRIRHRPLFRHLRFKKRAK